MRQRKDINITSVNHHQVICCFVIKSSWYECVSTTTATTIDIVSVSVCLSVLAIRTSTPVHVHWYAFSNTCGCMSGKTHTHLIGTKQIDRAKNVEKTSERNENENDNINVGPYLLLLGGPVLDLFFFYFLSDCWLAVCACRCICLRKCPLLQSRRSRTHRHSILLRVFFFQSLASTHFYYLFPLENSIS